MALEQKDILVEGFERVVFFSDPTVGFQAIVAIHNTILGPALGGTRIRAYPRFEDALTDVLRLAEGMTYKSALAGVPFGGGKSVIMIDPHQKTPEILRAFGDAMNTFNGKYLCAEDMGSSPADMAIVRERSSYVCGLAQGSGDPSRFTAHGVFLGLKAVAQKLWGSPSLKGRRIAIQGLGHVGGTVADLCFWEEAELIVADIDEMRLRDIVHDYHCEVVAPNEIHKVACDIFVPCAGGNIINDETLPALACRAVAGAANNQLGTSKHGDDLAARGILYVPDFVINSGGLINVAMEFEGYNPIKTRLKVLGLYQAILSILELAEKTKISPARAAEQLAKEHLEAAKV